MNISLATDFFAHDVVARGGFILSADTCNPAHYGPKMMGFVKALAPIEWNSWLERWDDYVWGSDEGDDYAASAELWDALEACTTWAMNEVPGLWTDEQSIHFGFNEHDGALLGWWVYLVEV